MIINQRGLRLYNAAAIIVSLRRRRRRRMRGKKQNRLLHMQERARERSIKEAIRDRVNGLATSSIDSALY